MLWALAFLLLCHLLVYITDKFFLSRATLIAEPHSHGPTLGDFKGVSEPMYYGREDLQLDGTISAGQQATIKQRMNTLYEGGDMSALLRYASRVQAMQPSLPDSYYYLGKMHLMEGDLGRALLQFDRALALAPEWLELKAVRDQTCQRLSC